MSKFERYNSWTGARDECRNLGGDLFSILSQEEQDLATSEIVLKFTNSMMSRF